MLLLYIFSGIFGGSCEPSFYKPCSSMLLEALGTSQESMFQVEIRKPMLLGDNGSQCHPKQICSHPRYGRLL